MSEENKSPRKHWRLSIVIACLLLVLLAGSSIFLITNSQNSKEHAASTSTARSATGITKNTAAARTSTPTLALTPVPSGTPQPLFLDYFIDNSNGWLTGSAGGYTRTLDEGALTLSANNHKILVESLPADNSFDDFSLTMNFMLKQGDEHDSVGLYVRGDSNLDHDYRIDIYGNSTYSISKESLDSSNNQASEYLVGPTPAPQLKPLDHGNRLTVLMKGPTLILMINDSIVQYVSDSDYTRGQIALFVQNGPTSNGVVVLITSISVYPAPDELPAAISTSGIPGAMSPTTTLKSN